MSNFKDVFALNSVFKIAQTTKDEQNFDELKSQLALIDEEFEELKEAIANEDWEQVKDAVGDILVVTYGMGYRANFDCDKLMQSISASNFSKLCRNQEEIDATVAYYDSIGVETFVEETVLNDETVWAIKSAKEQTYTEDGKVKSIKKGKFLKNINWFEPDLDVEF